MMSACSPIQGLSKNRFDLMRQIKLTLHYFKQGSSWDSNRETSHGLSVEFPTLRCQIIALVPSTALENWTIPYLSVEFRLYSPSHLSLMTVVFLFYILNCPKSIQVR
jgi:hypothetical protein